MYNVDSMLGRDPSCTRLYMYKLPEFGAVGPTSVISPPCEGGKDKQCYI